MYNPRNTINVILEKVMDNDKKVNSTMVMSILLLLVALAVVLFLVMDIGVKSATGVASPTPLSAEAEKGVLLLKSTLNSCLSGESRDAGLKAISDIQTGKFDISVGVSVQRILGAVDYDNEAIRAEVERDIRACIKDVMPKVQACILGDCQTATMPDTVGVQFKYPKTADTNLHPDKLRIGFAHKRPNSRRLLAYDPLCKCFEYEMGLPHKDMELKASLFNVVGEAFLSAEHSEKLFCLKRAKTLPVESDSFTSWQCGGTTCQHDGSSPRWFENCPVATVSTASFTFSLISKAYAQQETAQKAWYIPSLATLASREEFKGVGHTEFVLSNTGSLDVDADGYFVDLQVNGRSVMVDGTPASYNVQAYTNSKAIEYKFGLQNMDFAGRNGGCDSLGASIHFVKDGELLDHKIALERPYVALRHAAVTSSLRMNDTWEWRGTYHAAPNEYEYEVFLASVIDTSLSLATYQLSESAEALQRLKGRADRLKVNFDALNVTYEGQPLVAIIRPPLSKVSYGIAAGIVRPTGQVSFLFSKEETYKLLNDLKSKRAEGTNAYRRAVREDIFPYLISGGTTAGDLSHYGCS
jgi:hypothetical protein